MKGHLVTPPPLLKTFASAYNGSGHECMFSINQQKGKQKDGRKEINGERDKER